MSPRFSPALPLIWAIALALASTVAAANENPDVVVVGGGPSGLAAAIEARLNGASRVVVLEKRGPKRSRLNLLNLRSSSVDHLARLGAPPSSTKITFLREFESRDDVTGERSRRVIEKKRANGRRANSDVGDLFSGGAVAEMRINDMEDALVKAARRIGGIEVRMNTETTGIDASDERSAVVTSKDANGRRNTLRAKLVVVSDGANSSTRSGLGIKFRQVRGMKTRLVGAVFEQPGDGTFEYRKVAGRAVESLRLLKLGANEQTGVLAEIEPGLEFANDSERERWLRKNARKLGVRGELAAKPQEFETSLRRADRVVVGGTVVVIGDAARTTSVFTGQGVNFALKDAIRVGELYAKLRGTSSMRERKAALRWFSTETKKATERMIERSRGNFKGLRAIDKLRAEAKARPKTRPRHKPTKAARPKARSRARASARR